MRRICLEMNYARVGRDARVDDNVVSSLCDESGTSRIGQVDSVRNRDVVGRLEDDGRVRRVKRCRVDRDIRAGVRELIHVCRRRPAATRDDDIGRIEEEDSKLSVRRRRVHATGDAERTLT